VLVEIYIPAWGCVCAGISSAANIRTPSANDSGRSSTAADDDKFNQLVERIKDDQGMQQALFAYLPEGMRNKESVIRMVGSPEYRTMLESMMQVCRFHMSQVYPFNRSSCTPCK
jgi:hypothetical protein